MIEQQVELDGALLTSEMSPVKQTQTHLYRAGIEAPQRIFKPEPSLLLNRKGIRLPEDLVEHRFKELPRPVLVGLGQGRSTRGFLQSQMGQFPQGGR